MERRGRTVKRTNFVLDAYPLFPNTAQRKDQFRTDWCIIERTYFYLGHAMELCLRCVTIAGGGTGGLGYGTCQFLRDRKVLGGAVPSQPRRTFRFIISLWIAISIQFSTNLQALVAPLTDFKREGRLAFGNSITDFPVRGLQKLAYQVDWQ